jgi:predicted transcriptional regulator
MTDEELKAQFDAMRLHFDTSVESLRLEQETTRRHFDTSVESLRLEQETTRRHFDVTFESAKHEIGLLAKSVARVDEKLDRMTERLEQKIDTSAAETRAMIKFSHAELDRRVRTPEESSTH